MCHSQTCKGVSCVIADGALLQFYLVSGFTKDGRQIFENVIGRDSISSAIVHTVDPAFLSLCLDFHAEVSVHSYLYERQSNEVARHPLAKGTVFRLVELSELNRTVSFQQTCLGGGEELIEWLKGYSTNLISRRELFVLCRGDDWIGLGEYRKSDSQVNIVDVGVMVDPGERGQRWASYILSLLVDKSDSLEDHPICSTTVENIASQKAILGAGFESRNRILKVVF